MADQTIATRLAAVLSHDGILASHRAAYIRERCGIAQSTARRILGGHERMRTPTFTKLAKGLEVSAGWLFCGGLENVRNRRDLDIHYLAEWPDDPERASSMVQFIEQLRTLPRPDIAALHRMAIRLLNNDRKVARLIDMRERGQISRAQLLSMM